MKYRILGTCLLLLTLSGLFAADKDGAELATPLFNEANAAYQQGDFSQAVSLYDSILSQGMESVHLYYNLGNAHYKLGNIGPSVLNFERALKIQPNHKDAQFNLRLANLQVVDNIEEGSEMLFQRWGGQLLNSRNAGQWGIWAVVGIWLTLFTVGLLLYSNKALIKRASFLVGILCLFGTLFALFMGFQKRSFELNSGQGIVFVPNAYVKSAPDGQSTDLFILHEGAKVNISDEVEEWIRVSLPDGKEGWVQGTVIEKI